MADYNFLSLVNDVNGRMNEVPLNEDNFSSAAGWYTQAKEAVNAAIMHISHKEENMPFYYQTTEITLEPGVNRYPYPEGAETLKMDTFRIVKDNDLNNPATYLTEGDWEQLLKSGQDMDSGQLTEGMPRQVFRYPSLEFGVWPAPKAEYKLRFEWYLLPPRLEEYQDVPLIPYQWRHVIINGAMMYAYMFRGDPESSQLMQTIFDDNIKHMRKVYENRYVKVYDRRMRKI